MLASAIAKSLESPALSAILYRGIVFKPARPSVTFALKACIRLSCAGGGDAHGS